ncbi:hypothetical protein [Cytobacillus sp. IB215316]|uniref:hypothetical protein n=1 Tax=Cytobacillus sp. IB215316 TaxID=3097354 RepID=UPI0039B760E5
MLVMGDISIFTVHAVYNISMVLGFLPLTSIPLPFKLWFNAHCTKYNGCRYCTECVSKERFNLCNSDIEVNLVNQSIRV